MSPGGPKNKSLSLAFRLGDMLDLLHAWKLHKEWYWFDVPEMMVDKLIEDGHI